MEAIINQIDELNLTPILMILYDIQYKFASNGEDVVDRLDSEISELDSKIETLNESIDETERGFEIQISRLNDLNVDTDGCSVADKNKRKQNIIRALENRKSELQTERSQVQKEKDDTNSFYDTIINTLKDIINTFIQLLKRLIDIIGRAIFALESAITSLAAIPLGAGLGAVAVFGFILDLLQTKILDPVKDTVNQQEIYDRDAPPIT